VVGYDDTRRWKLFTLCQISYGRIKKGAVKYNIGPKPFELKSEACLFCREAVVKKREKDQKWDHKTQRKPNFPNGRKDIADDFHG
jgi:hypothetical protein